MRELEEKRINKEMANIRKKFKGLTTPDTIASSRLTGYSQTEILTVIRRRSKLSERHRPFHIQSEFACVSRYVAKIIFTYILGYKVDVGHMEAVNLISSSKYSEKQIVWSRAFQVLDRVSRCRQGYLAVTLLMHENSDFLRLVVNSIRKDLDENNEVNNCLALHAIANVGSSEMAEALSEDVHRLLISP